MKNHVRIVVCVAVLLVVGLVLTRQSRSMQIPGDRADVIISGAPKVSGVTYTEGTSARTADFAQAKERLEAGDLAGAEAIYRGIITVEPTNASGYIGLGTVLLLTEDYAAAQLAYQQALHYDPQSTMAYLGLGSVAALTGSSAQAIMWYEHALAVNPDLADAHYGVGIAAAQMGDTPTALTHLDRFLELAPASALAPVARALAADLRR